MQKLSLTDYPKIKPYLDVANYEGYNSNFVTMMMWDHEYHIQYEIHDHFLVMLHHYNETFFFAMPFCEREYRQVAIEYMIQYAKKHDFPFLIDGVTKEMKTFIQSIYKNQFMYQATPNNDDYIYEKKSLGTLAGKKMQKRRNHFNAFLKEYPDFIYKEIEDEDIDNVVACLLHWDTIHSTENSIQSEFVGIIYLLIHRHELPITTGCIYLNGVLEAFTIGSGLNHHTIQIHAEKANKDIRGLYVAIGKLFLENNYPGYLYVNREEDMGIPSLRKAKQSLHPLRMITKYQIYFKNTKIRKAKATDKKNIEKLWKICFLDEDEKSTTFYFTYCFKPENTYVLLQNNELIGAMQIVPYTIENEETVYFILGVSTKPEFQHNKCMHELLSYVLTQEPYASHRLFLQAYVPKIYYSFGFKEKYYHQKIIVDKNKYEKMGNVSIRSVSSTQQLFLYQEFCTKFQGYRIRDIEYYEVYLKERCLAFNDKIVGIFNDDKIIGYVIYHEDDLTIDISEIIYTSQQNLNKMVSHFANKGKIVSIECDIKATIHGKSKKICTMLTNDQNNIEIEENLFINELY